MACPCSSKSTASVGEIFPSKNIELKFRLTAEQMDKTTVLVFGYQMSVSSAQSKPTLLCQQDIYFGSPGTRTKLRLEKTAGVDGTMDSQISGSLITYSRPDQCEAKTSNYVKSDLGHLSDSQVSELLPMFCKVFGDVSCRVNKTRSLVWYENVRIHLDSVDALGDFVEFEYCVDDKHTDATDVFALLIEKFDLAGCERVAVGYSDLLRAKTSSTDCTK